MFNGRGLGEESSVGEPTSPPVEDEDQPSDSEHHLQHEPSVAQSLTLHQQFAGHEAGRLSKLARLQQQIVQLAANQNKQRATIRQLAMQKRQSERELAWTKYQHSNELKRSEEQLSQGTPQRSVLGVRSPAHSKADSSQSRLREQRQPRYY